MGALIPRATLALPLSVICLTVVCADQRISVLYTGDPYPGVTPYIHMKVEPLLRVTPIQASRDHYAGISQKDILRAIRVYMPRSYGSLIEGYHIVIISDSNAASFLPEQLRWFKRGIEEDEIGLIMIGGHETFGTNGQHPDWGLTPVGDVLPVDTIKGVYDGGPTRIVDMENPFIKSLPWRSDLDFLRNYACNVVQARGGSSILAISRIDRGRYIGWENPFFSTWDYAGKGRVFAMTGDWTPGGGWLLLQWEYLPDFVTNLMLYCTKRQMPPDLNVVHAIRTKFAQMGYRRMLIASLIDFVETFGANPRKILLVLADFEEAQSTATGLYIDQNYDLALASANDALSLLDEADRMADRVRNETLLWVYLSEWLAISATSMICGFLIWSLMVRRRFYKEIATTSYRTE